MGASAVDVVRERAAENDRKCGLWWNLSSGCQIFRQPCYVTFPACLPEKAHSALMLFKQTQYSRRVAKLCDKMLQKGENVPTLFHYRGSQQYLLAHKIQFEFHFLTTITQSWSSSSFLGSIILVHVPRLFHPWVLLTRDFSPRWRWNVFRIPILFQEHTSKASLTEGGAVLYN